MLSAIIVAAGSSRRMGFDKLLAPIGDRTVIAHAVEAFARSACVNEIILVVRDDRRQQFQSLFGSGDKMRGIVAGGEHRQDSVEAGLAQLDDGTKYVAVHDGARPLITPNEIDRVFEQARLQGAAALAEPVSDTLKRVNNELFVLDSVDRKQVYAMQTPQIFAREILLEAYRSITKAGEPVTDEVSAVQRLGRKVTVVPAEDFNFKVTFERDLRLAEAVLRERQKGLAR